MTQLKSIFDLAHEEQDRLVAEFNSDPEKQIYKTKGGQAMDLPDNWMDLEDEEEDEDDL